MHAVLRVEDEQLARIRSATADGAVCRPAFEVAIRDESGEAVATVEKTLWVKRR